MTRLEEEGDTEELLFYVGTIIRILFVFEPIQYDLERMLLMAPRRSELPNYAELEH